MPIINTESKVVPTWFRSERDENEELEWHLKPLSGLEFMQVQSGASVNSDGYFVYNGQSIKDALRFAILGWKGFSDEKGEPIPYTPYLLGQVGQVYLNEVFNEIINRAFVQESERKN